MKEAQCYKTLSANHRCDVCVFVVGNDQYINIHLPNYKQRPVVRFHSLFTQ